MSCNRNGVLALGSGCRFNFTCSYPKCEIMKWLEAIKSPRDPKRKTDIYTLFNKENAFCVGIVKWHTGFRKYSFFAANDCVFEVDCLRDIADFLEQLMKDRKVAVKYDPSIDTYPYSAYK